MGLRFRKSFKIAPGVRLNLNKKSVGVSIGGKGARYSISSSGRRTASVSVPGTGISYSKTKTKKKSAKSTPKKHTAKAVDRHYEETTATAENNLDETVKAASPSGNDGKSNWWKWAVAVVAICCLIGACFGNDQSTTSEETSTAIETESITETPSVIEESSVPAETETATETEIESTAESVSEEEIESEVSESTEPEVESVSSAAEPAETISSTPSQPEAVESPAAVPAETQAAVAPAASAVPDPVQNETSTMVWIPSTGSKSHSINNCGNMNPEKATQISLDEAISQGIPPCSKCW